MALDTTVQERDINALTEFSDVKQVRKKLVQSQKIVSEIVCYEPGQETVMHIHPAQDEVFYATEGRGVITFEDNEIPINQGETVFVPAGIRHGARSDADSRLVILFTKAPGVPPRTKREE